MTFATKACRLATVAAQRLHWKPGEFWAATPDELALSLGRPAEIADSPAAETIAALRNLFPDE